MDHPSAKSAVLRHIEERDLCRADDQCGAPMPQCAVVSQESPGLPRAKADGLTRVLANAVARHRNLAWPANARHSAGWPSTSRRWT